MNKSLNPGCLALYVRQNEGFGIERDKSNNLLPSALFAEAFPVLHARLLGRRLPRAPLLMRVVQHLRFHFLDASDTIYIFILHIYIEYSVPDASGTAPALLLLGVRKFRMMNCLYTPKLLYVPCQSW